MSRFQRALATLILFLGVTLQPTARAEAPASGQFDAIFDIIESLVLNQFLNIGGSVAMGGCQPTIVPGFPTVELKFTSSATCPLNGSIVLGILPLRANVRLEIMNNPVLQAVDADFTLSLRLKQGTWNLNWQLVNGRVAFRFGPGMPLNEWAMSGQGQRQRQKKSLAVASRVNFFDKPTGVGVAILRTVSKTPEGGNHRKSELCTLNGATTDKVDSGTLSECRILNQQ